jgi:hypothetical protein
VENGDNSRSDYRASLRPEPILLPSRARVRVKEWAPGIEWLERELAGMRSGIVLISHDRRLLERISRTTIWLDRGITRILNEAAATPWTRTQVRSGLAAGGRWIRIFGPPSAVRSRSSRPVNCVLMRDVVEPAPSTCQVG